MLVVGDSHTWMGGAGRQYPGWDTDCRAGRTTTEGLDVVSASLLDHHDVVAFDVATNDDEVPAGEHWADLTALRELVGHRQLVLVTNWRLDKPLGHVVDNHRRLAVEDPATTSVADWADYAAQHRAVFLADRVHFTDEALLVRTGIVWAGARSALLRAAAR